MDGREWGVEFDGSLEGAGGEGVAIPDCGKLRDPEEAGGFFARGDGHVLEGAKTEAATTRGAQELGPEGTNLAERIGAIGEGVDEKAHRRFDVVASLVEREEPAG